MKRQVVVGVLVALMILTATSMTFAAFPDRDIRMIVPWASGGGTDAITRTISRIAEKSLPVNIYVENIEGGLSGIGLYEVMKAQPDGYTLGVFTYDSVVTVPRKKLLPQYSLDKIRFVAMITREGAAVVVQQNARWKTFEDFVAEAKQKPGRLKIAVDGLGNGQHISIQNIEDLLGVKFKVLAYPGGSGEKKEALISGEVDAVMTSLGDFSGLINAGQVRGLVELAPERNKAFPSVPVFSELGKGELIKGSFVVIGTTAGTPDSVVKKLEQAFQTAHESQEFQDWAAQAGVSAVWVGADQIRQVVDDIQREEFETVKKLVELGIIKE